MGWKAACILINEGEPGYFGTLPKHDPEAARHLIERLGLGSYRSRGHTEFDSGIHPEHLSIGAYPGAAIVSDRDLVTGAAIDATHPLLRRLLALFPEAEVLVIELHSVVNYFGYAYYRRGLLQRAYAGSADDGIYVETGELQPEEQPYFARAVVENRERTFELDRETYTPDQVGELLVFELAGRFFGTRLDEFSGWDLTMEEFEREPA